MSCDTQNATMLEADVSVEEFDIDILTHSHSTVLLGRLRAYSLWTLEVWSTTQKEASLSDLMVMACGLPGETGEMLEQNAYAGTCKEDRRELVLEFGDVLYYWSRIICHFELDMALVLGVDDAESFIPAGASRMPISCGLVCEAIKKHVRNDHQILTDVRQAALVQGLGLMWQDMIHVMEMRSLSLVEVIEANQVKLRLRHSRQLIRKDNAQAAYQAHLEASIQGIDIIVDTVTGSIESTLAK